MDRPATVEGLVVAGWVDGQSAEELPLLGHHSDLSASHEEADGFAPVNGADADVSEPAAVAKRDKSIPAGGAYRSWLRICWHS
jgi:hypothetical protein